MTEIALDATRELLTQMLNDEITLEEYLEQSEKILDEMFPIEDESES